MIANIAIERVFLIFRRYVFVGAGIAGQMSDHGWRLCSLSSVSPYGSHSIKRAQLGRQRPSCCI